MKLLTVATLLVGISIFGLVGCTGDPERGLAPERTGPRVVNVSEAAG